MKKLLLFGSILLLVGLNHSVTAESQQTDSPPVQAPARELPSSTIDNIKVPYEVLADAQMEYQGYAVTRAAKIKYKGQSAYQLTVDRDDQPYNNKVIYLIYDMNWKLIGNESAMPRQQEAKPAEAPPQPAPEVADEHEEEPEEPEPEPEEEETPSEDPEPPADND